ncbi:MAG TPA: metallophosphoesterase family protein [Terriglobales bacterium]|nr:metallophosphoesterase family protein [Terriglobales bacterium]
MRVLVLSDIHANLEAMEACVAAAPEHDLVVNLGDVVGYGASPNAVSEKSRSMSAYVVRGNHDRACTGQTDLHDFNPVAAAAALWTQKNLSPENMEWLRGLPAGPLRMGPEAALPEAAALPEGAAQAGQAREPGEAALPLLVHGSPLDEDEYIISVAEALDVLMRSRVRLTLFGHSHIQGGFSLNQRTGGQSFRPSYGSDRERQEISMTLEPGTRYLINPGSVGQPRDGDWRAAFLLLDTSAPQITFVRAPYNLKGAQQRILDAKLPARLASRLAEGR